LMILCYTLFILFIECRGGTNMNVKILTSYWSGGDLEQKINACHFKDPQMVQFNCSWSFLSIAGF